MHYLQKLFRLLTVLLVLPLLYCNKKSGTAKATLFTLEKETGIQFTNTVKNTPDFNIFSYRNFYNGGGVATGDINNDGLPDICFTANMGENKLYLNKGNFKFEDITAKAGIALKDRWSTGVVMVDINHDGWLDIYVCNAGYRTGINTENALFINNHNNTFTDSAAAYGLNDNGYTTHAAFFDYDLDGDLDCYILNNSFIPVNTLNYANKRELRAEDWPVADFLKGGGDKLLRNDNGKFSDVSREANIYGSLIGFGLGVTVGDVNDDHYPDLYISNDFFERDYLYINQGNGTFHEELEKWIQHTSHSSMGADMADINNDGYPDIFSTDMLPADDYRLKTTSSFENIDVNNYKIQQGFYNQYMQNALQVNNRNGKFCETAYFSGVAASDWSWGALVFDADNDGLSDIYVCNGIYQDVTDQDFIDFFANEVIQKMALTGKKEEMDNVVSHMPSVPIPNKAFRNRGNLRFDDAAADWGLDQPSFSNGAAYADFDNDGDLDLVTNNVNMPAFVYRNHTRETQKGHYIGFKLKGNKANNFALGAQIKVFAGGEVLTREMMPTRGFQSSVDYKILIGLGDKKPDSVWINWPAYAWVNNGNPGWLRTSLLNPVPDSVYTVSQENSFVVPREITAISQPLMQPVTDSFVRHVEDAFNDFYYERNVPMMLSHEGPRAAVADVNADGREDVFICGAAKQPGHLFLQQPNGHFTTTPQPAFEGDADAEDTEALFFDADNDGDADLFVGSGGNAYNANTPEMQNRLYLNDGKGNFVKSFKALPPFGGNTAAVTAFDYDKDGDADLLTVSRNLSRNYGAPPQHALLQNDGHGLFTDVTASVFPALKDAGMLTGVAWANIQGDSTNKQLVLCGDWTAPRIFTWQNNRFNEIKTNISELFGWWQTVQAADLDGDGDDDLVLGNNGQNYYLRPDSASPVKLFIGDYDGNGTPDKVYSRTWKGRDVPVFLKKEFTEELPSFKKENLKHKDYAEKSIQELFSKEQLKNSRIYTCNYTASCIAWNEGNGRFAVQALPVNVQLSCTNALLCTDVNGDGLPDIVAGGNNYHCLPQFSRMDAAFGHVLLNRGKRQFVETEPKQSGVLVEGVVRDIVSLYVNRQKHILFLRNNDLPVMYRLISN